MAVTDPNMVESSPMTLNSRTNKASTMVERNRNQAWIDMSNKGNYTREAIVVYSK